jgi:hypothetical protein
MLADSQRFRAEALGWQRQSRGCWLRAIDPLRGGAISALQARIIG